MFVSTGSRKDPLPEGRRSWPVQVYSLDRFTRNLSDLLRDDLDYPPVSPRLTHSNFHWLFISLAGKEDRPPCCDQIVR